jgi:hypothetical protein
MPLAEKSLTALEYAKQEYDQAALATTELANASQEAAKEAEKTRDIEVEEREASAEVEAVLATLDVEVRTEVETAEVEHQAEQDQAAASATAEEAVSLAKAAEPSADAEEEQARQAAISALETGFQEDKSELDRQTKAAVALEKAETEADENAK